MLDICGDYFQTWRAVVSEEFGDKKRYELEVKWGKKLGENTARIYKKVGVVEPDDLSSLAKALLKSMRILNEDCAAIEEDKNRIRIVHYHCPENDQYMKMGIPGGCVDHCLPWYEATAKGVNPRTKVKLLKTFPRDKTCEVELSLAS